MTAHLTAVRNEARPISKMPERDEAIAAEVRAELARQQRPETQGEIAYLLYGEKQSWLNRRLRGIVAFTPGELLAMAAWLEVPVMKFLGEDMTPREPTAPSGKGTAKIDPTFPCLSDSLSDQTVLANVFIGPWGTPAAPAPAA